MTAAIDISHLDLTNKVESGEQSSHGGYSDIFRGTYSADDGNKRQVAVKALRLRGSSGAPAAKERLLKHFYREILLWQRFQHPNITPLLGYILPPNKPPALVSPWYIHGDALSYLELHPDADRNALALDVIKGLEYLHSFPIAHGDLKGENVLVDSDKRASLCDFGMSQFLDEASRITGFTTTNAHVGGTDRYMCPELLEDMPKTTATDIWALGCLLVQVLADKIPYQHITRRQAVLSAIVRGDPPSTNRPDAIGPSQWDYIIKCWNVAPEERPPVSELCLHFQPKSSTPVVSYRRIELTCSAELGKITTASCAQLSPDGKYLAAGEWDRIHIWDVDEPFTTPLKSLLSSTTTTGMRMSLSWSATQEYLTAVYPSHLTVWDIEARTIIYAYSELFDYPIFVTSPHIFAYTRLSKNTITIVDLPNWAFNSIEVGTFNKFALTPNRERIVLLDEESLKVYNIDGQCEFVTEKITRAGDKDISISKDGQHLLVSYTRPTGERFLIDWQAELWEMTIENGNAVLSLIRQYSRSRMFLGGHYEPQFGGPNDEWIVLFDANSLFIWDRYSGSFLYYSSLHKPNRPNELLFGRHASVRWNTTDPKDIVLLIDGYIFRGLAGA